MLNANFENPIKNFVDITKDHINKITKAMILKLQDHFIKLETKFDKTVSRRNYYVKGRRKRTSWTLFMMWQFEENLHKLPHI